MLRGFCAAVMNIRYLSWPEIWFQGAIKPRMFPSLAILLSVEEGASSRRQVGTNHAMYRFCSSAPAGNLDDIEAFIGAVLASTPKMQPFGPCPPRRISFRRKLRIGRQYLGPDPLYAELSFAINYRHTYTSSLRLGCSRPPTRRLLILGFNPASIIATSRR